MTLWVNWLLAMAIAVAAQVIAVRTGSFAWNMIAAAAVLIIALMLLS